MLDPNTTPTTPTQSTLPGPHSVGPRGTTYRQYCGRCDGSGTTEDGIGCPKCGGGGLVVNRPARLDTPELLAEMAADDYAHDAETLRWATVRAEALRVSDPFIRRQRAQQVAAAMVRRPWVEAI